MMMPRNLRSKIRYLLEDTQTMTKGEVLDRIEQFVLSEINFVETTHMVTLKDVELIRSLATTNIVNVQLGLSQERSMELEQLRTWAFIEATIQFLRGLDLIKFKLSYKDKELE